MSRRRTVDFSALDRPHFAESGEGCPSLLARTINANALGILARKEVEPRQTRGWRAQVRDRGKIARPMRHDTEQRTRVAIIDQCQLGLIRIERRALLRATGDRLSMQRHLCADRSVAGSPAGVNIQYGVKAAFGDVAVEVQSLARRANAVG